MLFAIAVSVQIQQLIRMWAENGDDQERHHEQSLEKADGWVDHSDTFDSSYCT